MEPSPRRGNVVLYAEDDGILRDTITDELERVGYVVVAARDGAEALQLFPPLGDSLRGVLTDFHMPRLNGADLARAVRSLDPDVPIIVWSSMESQDVRHALNGTPNITVSIKLDRVVDFIQYVCERFGPP